MKSDFNTKDSTPVRLCDLSPGQHARVLRVEPGGPASRRLLDFGLLPETPILAVRRAPLGSPTLYEFRGYRLCLRNEHAALVVVETESD
jgi:ferrous iron transport protein A